MRGTGGQRHRAGQAPAEGVLDVGQRHRLGQVGDGRVDAVGHRLEQVAVEAPEVDGVAAEDAAEVVLGQAAEDVAQCLAVHGGGALEVGVVRAPHVIDQRGEVLPGTQQIRLGSLGLFVGDVALDDGGVHGRIDDVAHVVDVPFYALLGPRRANRPVPLTVRQPLDARQVFLRHIDVDHSRRARSGTG